MEPPIQVIQHDIRQQWRNHPSLWCANRGGLIDSILHHPGGEKSFDQSQDVPIRHLGRNRRHNDGMRKIIEESLDIRVEHYGAPLAVEF